MSDKLNMDNYETVFFKLLEKEYSEEERKELIKLIEADTFYSFEWANWQKAVLVDESEAFAVDYKGFFDGIKAEADLLVAPKRKRIIPLYFVAASIAACLIIVFSVVFNLNDDADPVQIANIEAQVHDNVSTLEVPIKSTDSLNNQDQHNSSKIIVNNGGRHNKPKRIELAVSQPMLDSIPSVKKQPIPDIDVANKSLESKVELAQNQVNKKQDSTNETTLASNNSKAYMRKFTVSHQEVSKEEIYLSYADLENSSVKQLLEDKKITVIRKNNQMYVMLVSETEAPVYVSLDLYLNR